MNLTEKIRNIANPKLKKYKEGANETIKDFYESFIEPALPAEKTVREWNKLLLRYVDDSDAVFAVRAFHDRKVSCIENVKDDELRRGFLTYSENGNINYFFTDNFFTAYFVKMAIDNYCPAYDEFKNMMINRTFPGRFGRSCKMERDKAAYIINSKYNPGISDVGYKIAHIVDVGEHFTVDGHVDCSITELANEYGFDRGIYSDWKKNSAGFYIRNRDLCTNARKVLIAHYLRFVNPLNYVLLPKGKLQNKYYNVFYNSLKGDIDYDIAEYKPLLDYIYKRFSQKYGKEYSDFLERVLLNENFFNSNANGDEIINIKYGYFSLNKSETTKITNTKNITQKSNFDDETIAKVIKAFVVDGQSYRKIESAVLDLNPTETKGWVVMGILHERGVSSEKKGNVSENDFDNFLRDLHKK